MRTNNYTGAGYFVALALFLLPFVFSRNLLYAGVNAKAFFWLSVIALAALSLVYQLVIHRRETYLPLQKRPLLVALGLSILGLFVSSFFGIALERSLFSDIIRGSGVLFLTSIAFFAWWLSRSLHTQDWSLVRRSVLLSAALVSLLITLGFDGLGMSGRLLGFINLDIQGLTLANTTFAGIYLFLAFVFGCIEFVRTEGRRARQVLGMLLALSVISPLFINWGIILGRVALSDVLSNPALIIGTSRASSVTLILFLLWFGGLWALRRLFPNAPARAYIIWSGAFVVGVGVAITLLFTPGSIVQQKYTAESSATRLIVWEIGVNGFKERPLVGWGPENFRFAFERHFDNRLYLPENHNEVWFDRAHNYFIDTLVAHGLLGLLLRTGLLAAFVLVVVRARRAGAIGESEAWLLGMLPLWHLLELQTGFDTVSTYALGGVILGYVLSLERAPLSASEAPFVYRRVAALVILIVCAGISYRLIFDEYGRQRSLVRMAQTGQHTEQLRLIPLALEGTSGFEPFRSSLSALYRGVFQALPQLPADKRVVLLTAMREQLSHYEIYLRAYVERNPHDYRARMNYVYLLLVQTALGEGRIEDAKKLIDDSYSLSPENPLAYMLAAVTELYSNNIPTSRERLQAGLALNPDAPFSINMADYIERQITQLPNVSILKLENL